MQHAWINLRLRVLAPVLALALLAGSCRAAAPAANLFSGSLALRHALAVTEIGPRPPGSPEHEKTEQYILTHLGRLGLKPEVDTFGVSTPAGPRTMKNIVVKLPGEGGRAVLVAGHYETMLQRSFRFVGANDGGSSTGLLLELARVLHNGPPRKLGVWLAFLDGEEPLGGQWTASDSIYGSRHMAERLRATAEHRKLVAALIVDMIGDRDLDLLRDLNSTGWLNETVRDVAAQLRLQNAFGDMSVAIEDDHIPFSRIGLPVVDLIDFNYGPNNSYWHTAEDTPDKLSAKSLDTVGRIVLGTIDALGRRK